LGEPHYPNTDKLLGVSTHNLTEALKAQAIGVDFIVVSTIPIKAHKKYSYKLRGLNISHANHVWSTDITYIKIAGGMVYMAAIIDWHSKAVLSHRILRFRKITQ
jgi:thiamine monophosphate synthase